MQENRGSIIVKIHVHNRLNCIILRSSLAHIINIHFFSVFMMKKRDIPISKTVFSQLPPIGPEESTRPVALTPDPRSQQTDQRGNLLSNISAPLLFVSYCIYAKQWRIRRGFRGFARTPLPAGPGLKYPMKLKKIGLIETKLFHFHGIFKKYDLKSSKRTTTPLYIHLYEPPFMRHFIRVFTVFKSIIHAAFHQGLHCL